MGWVGFVKELRVVGVVVIALGWLESSHARGRR